MKRIIPFAALALAGCAATAPVVGQFTGAKDEFMGQATADAFGGTMSIKSMAGISCRGAIKRESAVSGNGSLTCSDGRTGTFLFTKSNTYGGSGFGTLSDGEKFRFLWGNTVGSRARCDEDPDGVACSRF